MRGNPCRVGSALCGFTAPGPQLNLPEPAPAALRSLIRGRGNSTTPCRRQLRGESRGLCGLGCPLPGSAANQAFGMNLLVTAGIARSTGASVGPRSAKNPHALAMGHVHPVAGQAPGGAVAAQHRAGVAGAGHADVEQVVPAEVVLVCPGGRLGRDVRDDDGRSIQARRREDRAPGDRPRHGRLDRPHRGRGHPAVEARVRRRTWRVGTRHHLTLSSRIQEGEGARRRGDEWPGPSLGVVSCWPG